MFLVVMLILIWDLASGLHELSIFCDALRRIVILITNHGAASLDQFSGCVGIFASTWRWVKLGFSFFFKTIDKAWMRKCVESGSYFIDWKINAVRLSCSIKSLEKRANRWAPLSWGVVVIGVDISWREKLQPLLVWTV